MTSPAIPDAVQAFIDATNAGDSAAFVAAFTPDATIDDWGHVVRGSDGVASWNRTENVGVQSHFEFVSGSPGTRPNTWVVVLAVTGNGFNGTGPMTFTIREGKIARLDIVPTS